MDNKEDYFPPSLPALSPSSTMDMVGVMDFEEDEAFRQFTNNAADDNAEIYFGLAEDLSVKHGGLDSPAPPSQTFTKFRDAQRPLGFGPDFSTSPDSSPKDSSSDSSVQHQSGSSSNSTGSGTHRENIPDANDQVTTRGAQESTSRPNVQDKLLCAGTLRSCASSSEKLVPRHDFDFRSGPDISAQVGHADPASHSPLRNMDMPFRSSPTPSIRARRGRSHRVDTSAGSNGGSPSSPMSKNNQTLSVKNAQAHSWMPRWPGAQGNNAMFNNSIPQPGNEREIHSGNQRSSENASSNFYSAAPGMPAAISMPAASPIITPSFEHMLRIHQKNDKSRVETQIPIRLSLYPMPVGITKLHLPSCTVSKPKQLADPSLSRSPDMLELDCMLVCTTAMRDEVKRQTAFACAAGPQVDASNNTSRELGADEELKPCDGGKVRICSTCVTREEKRASRKRAKVEDRAELWQDLAEDRVVIFNSNEVIEWQIPSESKPARSLTDSTAINVGRPYANSDIKSGAMQVDLLMRIACYCRHQDEKLGFQVIFTLKNHQGRLIAQSITNSITITDDHKTSTTPLTTTPQSRSYPENIQPPGAGVFSQESPNYYLEGSMRQAQSFSNLQSAQHLQSYQNQPNLQPLPYATPHILSQNASSITNPHSLSRQVSPSAPSGPYQKKRKPSGSGNVSNELTMTKLHSRDNINSPASYSMSSIGLASTTALANPGIYGASNNFIGQHQIEPATSMPARYNTNPPTPIRSETSWPTPSTRSQSMENISLGLGMPKTPPDLMNVSLEKSFDLPQNHMDCSTHSIREDLLGNTSQGVLPGLQNSSQPIQENRPSHPIITTIAPGEGPVAGGIEVVFLGTGFYQGLEFIFGDTLAITKSYLGEYCMTCILPPTTQAANVLVQCNHNYQGAVSWPPIQQQYFNYVDDNELQLYKLALATLHNKITGRREDPRKIARDTINGQHPGGSSQDDKEQSRDQHRQVSRSITALTTSADFEASLLGCLDVMDLDDSPNQPRFNSRGPNGQSMLHFSASLGYYHFAAALLGRGANPDLRDHNGMSPMHIASLNNHPKLIRKLRSAGGDPTLRSLRGLTPADMASTSEVRDVFDVIDGYSWPRGFGATQTSRRSRASSTSSSQPFWRARSMSGSIEGESDSSDNLVLAISDQEENDPSLHSHVATPAQSWARSRRNSAVAESSYLEHSLPVDRAGSDRFLAAATAWSVWRNQLIAQVQILHQSVHKTLPALPIPTLPPIPNLPDYQAYPVVRRISSLVPQRYPRALSPDLKESDYHWWELLRGTTAPPAYEELYPNKEQRQTVTSQVPAKATAGEALANARSPPVLAQTNLRAGSIFDTVKIDNSSLTLEQRQELMTAHAIKVKRLRSDRKLFFFWIPLLVFVLVAMLKDRVAQFGPAVNPTVWHLQGYFPGRRVPAA